MATIKSYTDIEQSKKLAEILPTESADMCYKCIEDDPYDIVCKPYSEWKEEYKGLLVRGDANVIPCWSLAALLQVLPLGIYDEFDGCDYELEIDMIDKMPRYIRLGDIYHSQFPYDFEKDTLLDNIVESIIWLNDNNYFEL